MLFPSDASDLLLRVPLSARTILEVGNGIGPLAAAYRPMNPKARLLGLAPDLAATTRAAPHMHQVATVDPERDPLPFDLPDGIDCIIYDDVLQHLRDPWRVIRRQAEALNPDGVVLIAVPNIEYFRFTEQLLRGKRPGDDDRHDPSPCGFSLEAMRRNLDRVGLTVCDVATRDPDPDAAARFAASFALGLEALGVDPREYAQRAAPSHLILRARKDPCQQLILAANMLDPVGGVSHVRVVYPVQAVATDPTISASVTDRVEIAPSGDETPRIFVLHRPALVGEHGHGLLRRLTDAGFLIVTEFDDLPDRFDMMRLGGALGFYGVHALQTSTIAMAEALREYQSEIAVFPNALGRLPEIRNFTDAKTMAIFFGALNREQDWVPLMPAINAVAAMAGQRLRFEVVHDRAFFDALDTPHKNFTPTCDYQTYMRLLAGCEISLMPLGDNRFNRAKSDLKFIEAGSCRVASLASTVVYGNSIEDGRTGLLFRDPVEFRARLLRLLAMPELARDLAEAARCYVAEHRMLAYQVAPRLSWYRSLWARRHLLEDARRERMMRHQAAAA